MGPAAAAASCPSVRFWTNPTVVGPGFARFLPHYPSTHSRGSGRLAAASSRRRRERRRRVCSHSGCQPALRAACAHCCRLRRQPLANRCHPGDEPQPQRQQLWRGGPQCRRHPGWRLCAVAVAAAADAALPAWTGGAGPLQSRQHHAGARGLCAAARDFECLLSLHPGLRSKPCAGSGCTAGVRLDLSRVTTCSAGLACISLGSRHQMPAVLRSVSAPFALHWFRCFPLQCLRRPAVSACT